MCGGPPRKGNGGGDYQDRRKALNKRTGRFANWDARNPESGGPQEGNGDRGSRGAQPWWRPFAPVH